MCCAARALPLPVSTSAIHATHALLDVHHSKCGAKLCCCSWGCGHCCAAAAGQQCELHPLHSVITPSSQHLNLSLPLLLLLPLFYVCLVGSIMIRPLFVLLMPPPLLSCCSLLGVSSSLCSCLLYICSSYICTDRQTQHEICLALYRLLGGMLRRFATIHPD